MFLLSFLKWFSYLLTGTLVLLFGIRFLLSLMSPRVPINQTTKTCLVTGASSGLGRALSVEMVKRGWKVIGVARRAALLEELQKQLGADNFVPYVCDVSNLAAVHKASENFKAQGLKPALFFLNAGIPLKEEKDKVCVTDHQKVFATNYLGAVAWVDEWLNTVKTYGGGTFVATSSIAALGSKSGLAAYCASKVALLSCFRSLRLQYLNDNIGFSAIVLGEVLTEGFNPEAFQKAQKGEKLPLLARLLLHLPEDDAHYIVEQVFKGAKQIEPSPVLSFFIRVIIWITQ